MGTLPNKVVALTGNGKETHENTIPYLTGKVLVSGKPTVYICQNYTCKRPITEVEEARKVLQKRGAMD